MSTYRRATEVAQLAYVLLTEYRPGAALHRALRLDETYQDSTDGGLPLFTIWANAAGSEVAGLVATMDAIQLTFDAACVAVAYDQTYPDRTPELPTIDALRDFAFSPIGSLQLYDLYSGTWGAKAAAVFRHGVTRAVISAVAPLTVVALHIACPALVIPTTITIAANGMGAALNVGSAILESQHRKKADRAREEAAVNDRRAREQADARRDQQISELQEALQRMRAERAAQTSESGNPVDNGAITDAGAKVTAKIADPPKPPDVAG